MLLKFVLLYLKDSHNHWTFIMYQKIIPDWAFALYFVNSIQKRCLNFLRSLNANFGELLGDNSLNFKQKQIAATQWCPYKFCN